MRLLLDTHVLIWWLLDDRRLKRSERVAITEADGVYVSAATIWEIAVKRSLGRLDLDQAAFDHELEQSDLAELPIAWRHARAVAALPAIHSDPFDRMLISQALVEDLTLVSYDRLVQQYDVPLLPLLAGSRI
ncbi:MAG: type II toxin-antitoxin system VapC family toxin [Acidobacteria bacterium]|nr:type II toxin-antitoxin system VapC family toxin [Acidobacteriota bacterium]